MKIDLTFDRKGTIVLLCLFVFGVCNLAFSQDETYREPNLPKPSDVQSASVANRTIDLSSQNEFNRITRPDPESPKMTTATANDLVVKIAGDETVEPFTAVVCKPIGRRATYEIPMLPPGDDAGRFLKQHLSTAVKTNASLIKFPALQTFELVPPAPGGRHLKFESMTDVTIDLNGSTLQFRGASLGILVQDCQRMVLRNGRIVGSTLLASVARVEADESAAGIKFVLLPEFQQRMDALPGSPPSIVTLGTVESLGENQWSFDSRNYQESFVNRQPFVDRFIYDPLVKAFVATSPSATLAKYRPGKDIVWLQHQNNVGHAILLDNEDGHGVEDITLEKLTFSNIPGMVIVGEVVRGLHVDGVRIEPIANDPAAFLAASSDCVHINANGGDIVIENSYLGPNADDKINIKGNYWRVRQIESGENIVTVVPAGRKTSVNRWGWSGNRIIQIDDSFSVIAAASLQESSVRENGKRHRLILDTIPQTLRVGSLVGNLDNAGPRVVIRNNQFESTRAQGVLVQSGHVSVTGNRFARIASPAIKLNLSINDWYEAITVQNVEIADNQFFRCAFSRSKSQDVIFVNQFAGDRRPIDIIDGVSIKQNRLIE